MAQLATAPDWLIAFYRALDRKDPDGMVAPLAANVEFRYDNTEPAYGVNAVRSLARGLEYAPPSRHEVRRIWQVDEVLVCEVDSTWELPAGRTASVAALAVYRQSEAGVTSCLVYEDMSPVMAQPASGRAWRGPGRFQLEHPVLQGCVRNGHLLAEPGTLPFAEGCTFRFGSEPAAKDPATGLADVAGRFVRMEVRALREVELSTTCAVAELDVRFSGRQRSAVVPTALLVHHSGGMLTALQIFADPHAVADTSVPDVLATAP